MFSIGSLFTKPKIQELPEYRDILTGVDILDIHHIQYFEFVKTFKKYIENRKVRSEKLTEGINYLYEYLEKVLKCENFIITFYLSGKGCTRSHLDEHSRFIKQVDSLIRNRVNWESDSEFSVMLIHLIEHWFNEHIKTTDILLGKKLVEVGYTPGEIEFPQELRFTKKISF